MRKKQKEDGVEKMAKNESLLLQFRIAVLKEIAEAFKGQTIENIIRQLEDIKNEKEKADAATN